MKQQFATSLQLPSRLSYLMGHMTSRYSMICQSWCIQLEQNHWCELLPYSWGLRLIVPTSVIKLSASAYKVLSQTKSLNIWIFEMIYHGVLEASSEMAKVEGPYETWVRSLAQQGWLQYDLWNVTLMDLWDWMALKEKIAKTGLRNSLLCVPMLMSVPARF